MKKKVLYVLSVLVLLAIAVIFGGHAWLKSRFEKEALIVQIEQQLNCRVQIDGSSASILSSPAKVELLQKSSQPTGRGDTSDRPHDRHRRRPRGFAAVGAVAARGQSRPRLFGFAVEEVGLTGR